MDLELHWYVSYVKSCREKSAARSLTALGVENFLPVSTVKRKWSDRIRLVERLLLPHMIFIRTNEIRRVELLKEVDGLRFVPPLNAKSTYLVYQCQSCQQRYQRKRKIDTKRYCCGVCRGKLVILNRPKD